jgi:predicted Zn-dependent protease
MCIRVEADALAGVRAALATEAQFGGVMHDPRAEQRMAHVGTRLAHGNAETRQPHQYHLLASDRLDALSLPGGRIYVTRGLFVRLDTDELLAAVLAHEMAHITAGDHFKTRVGDRNDALEREIAADARGTEYLLRAGIDPRAMIRVVRLVEDGQPQGWVVMRTGALRARIESTNRETRP